MGNGIDTMELDGKTILITGAAGFIGAALAERLLTESDAHIVGIDNMNDYYDVSLKEYRLTRLEEHTNFTFFRGDLADKSFVADIFEQYRPSVIVNLAAQAGVRYSITNPDVYINSNIIGFYNILEACRHSYDGGGARVEHLVYASSSSVYGSNKKVPYSTEDKVDNPVSLYAATKKSNELMAHAYSKLYDIPSTGLRFFTVYGPAGRPDMAYFGFTNRLRAGEKIQIFNYGNCQRDFTYIDDIVEGIVRVMQKPPERKKGEDGLPLPPHAVYNIGNNHPENLLDFVDILQQELIRAGVLPEDYDFGAHKELVPMQPGDVPVTYADTAALERDFGFKPHTSLREGLRRFAQWYKEFYQCKTVGKVLILGSSSLSVFGFRGELVERLVADGYEVVVSFPSGQLGGEQQSKKYSCKFVEIGVDRRGTNPVKDIATLIQYVHMLRQEQPSVVLGFTVKCDIYGGIACRLLHTPFVANITGLGKGLVEGGVTAWVTRNLYKPAVRNATVFFQNKEDQKFFDDHKIKYKKGVLVPGSGVNIDKYVPAPYPSSDVTVFTYLSRVMKTKGIEQYLEAARVLHADDVEFHICGYCEENYKELLSLEESRGTITYHGLVSDVRPYIAASSCIVSPSFHPEGVANVLLEAAACARPIITTDRVGCKETVEDGVTGYLVKEMDSQDLIEKMRRFLSLTNEQRREMGLRGREKVVKEFDRRIVTEAYMSALKPGGVYFLKCNGGYTHAALDRKTLRSFGRAA